MERVRFNTTSEFILWLVKYHATLTTSVRRDFEGINLTLSAPFNKRMITVSKGILHRSLVNSSNPVVSTVLEVMAEEMLQKMKDSLHKEVTVG